MVTKGWAKWAVTLLAVVGVQACLTGSICADVASASKSLKAKAEACPSLSGSLPAEPSDADVAACEKVSAAGCTTADESLVTTALNCIQKASACEAGKEEEFGTALETCTEPLQGLSSTCQQLVGVADN